MAAAYRAYNAYNNLFCDFIYRIHEAGNQVYINNIPGRNWNMGYL
jgi:hypothetical protein